MSKVIRVGTGEYGGDPADISIEVVNSDLVFLQAKTEHGAVGSIVLNDQVTIGRLMILLGWVSADRCVPGGTIGS